jgi:hypothetical protein
MLGVSTGESHEIPLPSRISMCRKACVFSPLWLGSFWRLRGMCRLHAAHQTRALKKDRHGAATGMGMQTCDG